MRPLVNFEHNYIAAFPCRFLALKTTGCGLRQCTLFSETNGLTCTVDLCGKWKVLNKAVVQEQMYADHCQVQDKALLYVPL